MPVVHPSFPEKVYFSYRFDIKYLAVSTNTPQGSSPSEYFTFGPEVKSQCQGSDPEVCLLSKAVKLSSSIIGADTCLYSLFTDSAAQSPVHCKLSIKKAQFFATLAKEYGYMALLVATSLFHAQTKALSKEWQKGIG